MNNCQNSCQGMVCLVVPAFSKRRQSGKTEEERSLFSLQVMNFPDFICKDRQISVKDWTICKWDLVHSAIWNNIRYLTKNGTALVALWKIHPCGQVKQKQETAPVGTGKPHSFWLGRNNSAPGLSWHWITVHAIKRQKMSYPLEFLYNIMTSL